MLKVKKGFSKVYNPGFSIVIPLGDSAGNLYRKT